VPSYKARATGAGQDKLNASGTAPHRFLERVITYDEKVPLSDDDRAMENGWRCIPVPPTDDPEWFIIDSSRDRKTVWGRWHECEGAA
jgi:hypothetical protein